MDDKLAFSVEGVDITMDGSNYCQKTHERSEAGTFLLCRKVGGGVATRNFNLRRDRLQEHGTDVILRRDGVLSHSPQYVQSPD